MRAYVAAYLNLRLRLGLKAVLVTGTDACLHRHGHGHIVIAPKWSLLELETRGVAPPTPTWPELLRMVGISWCRSWWTVQVEWLARQNPSRLGLSLASKSRHVRCMKSSDLARKVPA